MNKLNVQYIINLCKNEKIKAKYWCTRTVLDKNIKILVYGFFEGQNSIIDYSIFYFSNILKI